MRKRQPFVLPSRSRPVYIQSLQEPSMSMRNLQRLLVLSLFLVFAAFLAPVAQLQSSAGNLKFAISFPAPSSKDALDGRMLLLISKNNSREPRFQINEDLTTQQVFGVNVDGLRPGAEAVIDANAFGYPIRSLSQLKPGDYWVQGLLHRYETFKRSDGHTVKLPMDRGEGQQWARAPGNLYSTPLTIAIDPKKSGTIAITLDKTIAPLPTPSDSKYVKHEKIQSERLTKFWGRPMHPGAHVLLPEWWDSRPDARYPLFIYHGHFPADLTNWRDQPPDPTLKPDFSARFNWPGYNRTQQEYGWQFF